MSEVQQISAIAQSLLQGLGASVVSIGRDGRGSGVVIAPGKVLTNAHNLQSTTTQVTFADGRAEQGTVTAVDGDGDLVVLDVDTAATPVVTWADNPPVAGDVVFALGRGGHRSRISFGLVATADLAFDGPRGRQIDGGVEHTAQLARGSSGGPIADEQGRVLGLNTHRVGNGFYVARPVNASLRATIDGLTQGKSVTRRRLGVALAPPEVAAKLRASVGLPARDGLLVRGVESDGPAARAGITEGDLLVAAGATTLSSMADFHSALAAAGDEFKLVVVRGNDERNVVVSFAPAA